MDMAKKKAIKIHETLPALLKARGMSLSQLSRKTGTPLSTLSTWLDEGAKPKDPAAVALCAGTLGATMHHLLFGLPEDEAGFDQLKTEVVLSGYYKLRLERVIPHSPRKQESEDEQED